MKSVEMPAIFGRLSDNAAKVKEVISKQDPELLLEKWKVEELSANRMRQWCLMIADNASRRCNELLSMGVLRVLFPEIVD